MFYFPFRYLSSLFTRCSSLVLLRPVSRGAPWEGRASKFGLAANGSTPYVSSSQVGFPATKLNDGSLAAWGSKDGTDDVFAWIRLPKPVKASTIRILLFSPGGHARLRDFSIVARKTLHDTGLLLQSRLRENEPFREKI